MSFMDNIRTFFGFTSNPPRNDFRNPIWSSDDEDDGDELYTRQHNINVFHEAADLHQEFTNQMQEMLRTFGSLFGEFKSKFNEDQIDAFTSMTPADEPDSAIYAGKSIRDYYLKPGYQNHVHDNKEDIDLDGKISSNEISGMLKQKKDSHNAGSMVPFNGNLVPGRSFCRTVITTSITKPDGTVETKRIIKNGNEVIEETTTSTAGLTGPDTRGPPGLDQISSSGLIVNHVMSELSSLFRNYH